MRPIVLSILFCFFINLDAPAQKNVNCASPFGVWTRAPYDSLRKNRPIVSVNLVDTFYYHRDTTITLYLLIISRPTYPPTVLPADSRYRLKARWEGNDVFLRFKNGSWFKTFTWNVDHFEDANDSTTIYNFLPCEKLKTLKSGILKRRKLY